MKKQQCRFCPRQIAACGMPAHIHFKHLEEYLAGIKPILQLYLAIMPDPMLLLTDGK